MGEASTSLLSSLLYQILTCATGAAALEPGASSMASTEINPFFVLSSGICDGFVLVWVLQEQVLSPSSLKPLQGPVWISPRS